MKMMTHMRDVTLWVDRLRSEDEGQVGLAANELAQALRDDRVSVNELLLLAKHQDANVRAGAAWALYELPVLRDDLVPIALSGLSDLIEKVRYWSLLALKQIGTDLRSSVVILVIPLVDDQSRSVRIAAAEVLLSCSERDFLQARSAIASSEKVAQFFQGFDATSPPFVKDRNVESSLVAAIGWTVKIGIRLRESIALASDVVECGDLDAGTAILGTVRGAACSAVSALQIVTQCPETMMRARAWRHLGAIGRALHKASGTIVTALCSQDSQVADAAVSALSVQNSRTARSLATTLSADNAGRDDILPSVLEAIRVLLQDSSSAIVALQSPIEIVSVHARAGRQINADERQSLASAINDVVELHSGRLAWKELQEAADLLRR